MARKRLIVNADDYGWSDEVSAGILRVHREGIVTSTTLMSNMPAAKTALAALDGAAGTLGMGIHLNICQGPPLTRAGVEQLAGDNGIMDVPPVKMMKRFLFHRRTRRAIVAEMEAQIAWALEQGVHPTHLDSHRHLHAFPPIFSLVTKLAKRYKIRFIRWPKEHLTGQVLPADAAQQRTISRMVRAMMLLNSWRLRKPGRTDAFFGIAATGYICPKTLRGILGRVGEGVTELMVHPGYIDHQVDLETRLVDSREVEMSALCDAGIRQELKARGIELIHYGNL